MLLNLLPRLPLRNSPSLDARETRIDTDTVQTYRYRGASMTELPHPTTRDEILARLREAMVQGPACTAETVSSGCPDLDAALPGGGFRRGTLVEWLGEVGAGAGVLAMLAAAAACGREGTLLVVDGDGTHTRHSPPSERFYPPAAVGAGLAAQQLIVVRPANAVDYTWALDQAMRCPGLSAVLAWPQRLSPTAFRRLQLAAEESGTLGFLVRPATAQKTPSWADVRLLVHPQPQADPSAGRRLQLELVRCRGAAHHQRIVLESNHATGTLRVVARNQQPPSAYRRAR